MPWTGKSIHYCNRLLKNTAYGNIIVWSSLVIGQPALIMMYVQAYINEQKSALV